MSESRNSESTDRFLRVLVALLFLVSACPRPGLAQNPRLAVSRPSLAGPPREGQTQAPEELTVLETGKPLTRELSGGQKHSYQLELRAEQYVKLVVEQHGIDVVIRLLGADGTVITDYDSEQRIEGTEPVEFTSRVAGTFKLSVESKQRTVPPGHYEIAVSEVRTATNRDFSLDEARRLNSSANRLWRADKYDEALPLVERALAIREKELGPNHPDVATSLFVLANNLNDKGDYARAEPLFLRAVQIKESALGKDDLSVSLILNNLGNLYKDKGDYVKAESVFQRALEIREKVLQPDNLLIAGVLNNLANVAHQIGDIAKASALYQRALKIREKILGPEHQDVATTLNNIANLYSDVPTAEPLYRRALAIREKTLPPDHPDIGQTLYNLSVLYSSAGDYAKAEGLCRRALSIYEQSLGPEHPYTSYPVNLLAVIYKNTGEYSKSEALYQRAISIKEKTQGQFHPDLGGTYANLANLYAVEGDLDRALLMQTKANSIVESNIALNVLAGSERQKLEYLKTLSDIEDQTITLHLQSAPDSTQASELASTVILQRQGRVLDALSSSLGALLLRFNKQDQSVLSALNSVAAELAGRVLDGPQNLSTGEYQRQIKQLEEKRETLEGEVSRRSAGFFESTQSITLKMIQASIPSDSAVVEIAIYHPISPKSFEFSADRALDPNAVGEPRYAAYVIRSKGEPKGVELGTAREIDQAIDDFRQALRDPKRKDVQSLGRAIDKKVMQPIRALAGDSTHFLISPDGELNLIPFEALVDERGQYLVERFQFTYLTSGRDLLRMKLKRDSKSGPVVFANPMFGDPPAETVSASNRSVRRVTFNSKRRSATNTRNLSELYFGPLSGTELEARSIRTLFPDASLLSGSDATETAMKAVNAPKILHVATHGFFLQSVSGSSSRKAQATPGNSNVESENPLMRSGLAFAGANLRQNQGDDGVLTALEASGLNLWGTKLVVLSACDTGVGEVRTGEGVYGLRRAFTLAGAESLLMSLWPASDYVTRELMTNYYRNLKQGLGRGAALRQVQLDAIKRNRHSHPFYWANFIQSNDWTSIKP